LNAILTDRVKTNNSGVLNNIEKIDTAMSKEDKQVPEKISFKYLKYSISNLNQQVERRYGSRYEVSPYALLINDGNYYLLAYNDYVKDLRTYRVDRMKDVKLLGIEREGKEVFDKINLKNYTQRVFSMFDGEQERITIQFINPLLDAVVDRFGKKGMLYKVVDDKHFSITAPVESSDQFYGWVLGFGNKAKILKPQKIVDGFTEYLDKIRNTYES
jgi:predicted DNA-binding transcriptional regulator YafY